MIRNVMELNGIKRFSEKESEEIIWSKEEKRALRYNEME